MSHGELRCAARTEVGRRGGVNEDAGYAGGRVFGVADGMGGHPHGEVASGIAVAALAELDRRLSGESPGLALEPVLVETVAGIGRRLTELAAADPELGGMGTTLTALVWAGDGFAGVHLGDSRAYLLRDGQLRQLTRDHTFVGSLVEDGRITAGQAAAHPRRSMLLRALQAGATPEPELFAGPAKPGDRYLICSDGLTGFVPIEVITQVVQESPDPESAADRLIALAIEAGVHDNTTCVVVDMPRRSWFRRRFG